MKASLLEVRPIVRQVLAVLIPAVPQRMDDGHATLATLVKRAIIEDVYSSVTLTSQHLFYLLHRHADVFYAIRHQLIGPLIATVSRFISTSVRIHPLFTNTVATLPAHNVLTIVYTVYDIKFHVN